MGFSSQENELIIDELAVEGSVPEWLTGVLIRTAPSKFEVGKNSYRHWFDGLAMLHKFSFANQKVSYACKFLESNAYREALKKNKIVYGEFGTDPCQDLFRKVFSFFQRPGPTDNGCVNINLNGQALTATTETPKPVAFNLTDLETKGLFSYEDDLGGQLTIVHPHYDEAGTLFSYLTQFGYRSKYNIYFQALRSNKRTLIATVPAMEPAYMHSIGMTRNYIILTEFPIVVNPLKLRFGNKPFIENYTWKPGRGTQTHLVEKKSGAIQTFKAEPYFAFHHANAFEQHDEVVFDIVAYNDAEVINQLYLHHLRSDQTVNASGQLWRFHINPASKTISREVLSTAPIELPRINYAKVNGRPYQYVYGAGTTVAGNFLDNITKINLAGRQEITWHQDGCYPGEPVFVERPEALAEDDGILLSIVLDVRSGTSFLLILDAKDLHEIARAKVPQHITFGFHGQYFRGEEPAQVIKTIHK